MNFPGAFIPLGPDNSSKEHAVVYLTKITFKDENKPPLDLTTESVVSAAYNFLQAAHTVTDLKRVELVMMFLPSEGIAEGATMVRGMTLEIHEVE